MIQDLIREYPAKIVKLCEEEVVRDFLIFVFFLFILAGCLERGNIEIKEVTPTRMGIGIELNGYAKINYVSIAQGSREIYHSNVEAETNRLLLDFKWQEGKEYLVTLKTSRETLREKIIPQKPLPFVLAQDGLGKPKGGVEIARIDEWSKVLYEEVDVSPQGLVAVGSFDRTVRVYSPTGEVLWKHRIPTGVIRTVKFSPQSDYLLAGEASPDGTICCFEVKEGKICWKYQVVNDTGRSEDRYYAHQPKVCSIMVTEKRVYVSAARSWEDYVEKGGKKIKYWPRKGIVYAFDLRDGRVLWKFPQKGVMDTTALRLSLDKKERYLIFGGWGGSANGNIKQDYPENTLYVLDAKKGKLIYTFLVEPLKRFGFNTVSIGSSCDISSNGRYIGFSSSDGRLFLLDNEERIKRREPVVIYEKVISKPIEVNRVPIYAYGGKVLVDDEGQVILIMGRTYIAPMGKGMAKSPRVRHPLENRLYEMDKKGEPVWIWQGEGPIEMLSLSADGRSLVVAMSHNYVQRRKEMAGIYCFDRSRKELLWHFPFEGIGIACGISTDGRYIAGIEGPIDVDPRMEYEREVGKHRIWVIS